MEICCNGMGRKIVVRVNIPSGFFFKLGRITASSPEVLRSADVRNVLVSELKLKCEVICDRLIVAS